MARRLPPLIALRALEAAARLKSYSRAADELNVTHGAVSQQIRRLEDELGLPLFHRRGNAMEPTAAAARMADRVGEALALLHAGVAEITEAAVTDPLVVSSMPEFARLWLTPRLRRLAEETQEDHLELRLSDQLANLTADGVDAAIRYGPGGWPDLVAAPLLEETLFPVCSPGFLKSCPLRAPKDLLGVPLLRHTHRPWSLWFDSVGLHAPTPPSGMIFDDSGLLLDAAAEGLGVALARGPLVAPALRDGRLVRPFADEARLKTGYFFVWRADSRKLRRILRLRDWMIAEVAKDSAAP